MKLNPKLNESNYLLLFMSRIKYQCFGNVMENVNGNYFYFDLVRLNFSIETTMMMGFAMDKRAVKMQQCVPFHFS